MNRRQFFSRCAIAIGASRVAARTAAIQSKVDPALFWNGHCSSVAMRHKDWLTLDETVLKAALSRMQQWVDGATAVLREEVGCGESR